MGGCRASVAGAVDSVGWGVDDSRVFVLPSGNQLGLDSRRPRCWTSIRGGLRVGRTGGGAVVLGGLVQHRGDGPGGGPLDGSFVGIDDGAAAPYVQWLLIAAAEAEVAAIRPGWRRWRSRGGGRDGAAAGGAGESCPVADPDRDQLLRPEHGGDRADRAGVRRDVGAGCGRDGGLSRGAQTLVETLPAFTRRPRVSAAARRPRAWRAWPTW